MQINQDINDQLKSLLHDNSPEKMRGSKVRHILESAPKVPGKAPNMLAHSHAFYNKPSTNRPQSTAASLSQRNSTATKDQKNFATVNSARKGPYDPDMYYHHRIPEQYVTSKQDSGHSGGEFSHLGNSRLSPNSSKGNLHITPGSSQINFSSVSRRNEGHNHPYIKIDKNSYKTHRAKL